MIAAIMAIAVAMTAQQLQGFVHGQSEASDYEWPTDECVIDSLQAWRDLKFGVLLHWGLYSVPGIVESWSICSEDVDWINRKGNLPYDDYKKWYWSLSDSLNPKKFDPGQWADIMKSAGMRYAIFTTKHHDGFCMFDTHLTDFSIAKGPFATNEKSDVARHVFDAFRERGFRVGAYFSKPDWHCEWFWNPGFATSDRHINYKKERHPDWWKRYCDFTSGQIGELLSGRYGRLDILWLDGGWIRGDEIGLDSLLHDARAHLHPGLISVDRSIGGRNENYHTPERGIPSARLEYPWESCITLSNDWGWVPDAPYKSPEKIISLLAEITAKGGCLLLGVGPTADGQIEPDAEWRLRAVGDWLRRNGEAIYSTVTIPVYNDGQVWFTSSKDCSAVYAIFIPSEDEGMPREITWRGNEPKGNMTILDGNRRVRYSVGKDGMTHVRLPRGLKREPLAMKFTLK